MSLKGKKILLLSVPFFNYDNAIRQKLRELGAEVDYYSERSVSSALNRAIIKVFPHVFDVWTLNYYKGIVNNNKKDYDYVLFNGTEMAFKKIIELVKESYPHAKLMAYEADSILGDKCRESYWDLFDTVYTYDRRDYEYYVKRFPNFKFRPLYYADEYREKHEVKEKKYDLTFIGTIHSDRNRIINTVCKQCENAGLRTYLYRYLQAKFMYIFYKIKDRSFKENSIKDYSFDKIDGKTISEIYSLSTAVLDMQHPRNVGLTMRTIETIESGLKLVTTNEDIVNYDFYRPENIQVIDRNNPTIDPTFFKTPYVPIEEAIMDRYSLEYWLREIFEDL